ncbi:putative Rho guanyl nucleotide exchange factor [Aspergillus candidus]|uniref:Putative Rho guanyl nucleotide exchange factor n=1 Tax=Aspergillus candidus TaxID=41067 RepID=A0A2I2FN56_ASPCN|nr:putative Rho guanyl nucleotide exchange factor [Aspergillus candidus]PLB42070.1 putative Rho guanyl nucleotide exchange factor [Aspergillus candidus]
MATSNLPPDLPWDQLTLYHTSDPYLSSIFVFYGPVTTANATVSSSRIQAHILTPAGCHSYPRITVSPAAPLYAAVHHLPRDKQGDEVARGLAVAMLKYFADLPNPARDALQAVARAARPADPLPKLFDEMHAADLAHRLTPLDQTPEIVRDLRAAFQERSVPWVDLDVVLPAGSIQPPPSSSSSPDDHDDDDDDDGLDCDGPPDLQYGPYTPLIRALGPPIFLPTARLKRAPSQSTNLSRSKVFSPAQKQALRMTMCEFVDTEERYVNKLYTLVRSVAEEFHRKANARPPSSTSPDAADLARLFPPCLHDILELHLGFLDVIRQVLETTEPDAIDDLTQDTDLSSSLARRSARDGPDRIGAVAFAAALVDWFPRFAEPYAAYLRAHTGFTQTLNTFLQDKQSSFTRRVQDTGEQLLRSLLMEPVQRLPRYSLLIDTMTGSLPLLHPAVRPLLQARDVVTDICALDDAVSASPDRGFQRLSAALVDGWPAATIRPAGRLVTAIDVHTLAPPYHRDRLPSTADPGPLGILLVYQNALVLLAKGPGTPITARGLATELDSAASATAGPASPTTARALQVIQVYPLRRVRCTQSTCGRILFLAAPSTPGLHALEPTAMYEGRAGRVIEEIVKAQIAGRFPEREREDGKWTLRSPTGTVGNLGILACVVEDAPETPRPASAPIRLVIDPARSAGGPALGSPGLEVLLSVTPLAEDQFRLDLDSIVGQRSSDIVTAESFVPVLSKRLSHVLSPLHGPQNRTMAESIIHANLNIIRDLSSYFLAPAAKASKSFRPPSPSKLLSSLLGSGPTGAKGLGDVPKMPPPRGHLSRSNTLPSVFPGKEEERREDRTDATPPKVSVVGSDSGPGPESTLPALERAFAAYALALQSRSGNIVGRTLRARDGVDRSAVNELYNVLLEDPGKLQAAAEVPVDTLFVAFETFMANAWSEQMGPVLDPASLALLQGHFDTMFPRDFDESFRRFLSEMSPQNCRALAALVRLLADLLDASGNDGDRGALTAVFAEVLTTEGDPMHHVSLLDRLVDDFDHLFEEVTPDGASLEAILSGDPTPSAAHNRGSVSSTTSSFRKRFGFSLHRDSSKAADGESKVSSILRTLSKSKGSLAGDSEPGTPKGSLLRSKSIDVDAGLAYLLRPGSRDRLGTSSSQEHFHRPASAQEDTASVSSVRGLGGVKVRRKRRSSLSDLRPGTASSEVSTTSTSHAARPATPASSASHSRSDGVTPTKPPRPQSRHGEPTVRSTSPQKSGSPSLVSRSPTRPVTPSRKENIDPKFLPTDRSPRKKKDASESPQEPKRRSRATSIPARNPGLKERPVPVNGSDVKRPTSSLSSPPKPQKLRMQSPQKLRDRLQSEKRAQNLAQLGLKDELDLIGEELQSLKLASSQPGKSMRSSPEHLGEPFAPQSNTALITRMRNLETKFDAFSGEFHGRTSSIERDLESTLVVSEKRVKKLDELYREASAENEALYDRFNSELSKVAKDARSGNVDDALSSQLSAALEEVGRLKKENFRLKREVGGLRAQQAAVALLKAGE